MRLSCLVVIFALIYSCGVFDPLNTQFDDIEDAEMFKSKEYTQPEDVEGSLKVMTWNIKYGGGKFSFYWEKDGTKYNMKPNEVYETLEGIVDVINNEDPDIIILQEVDKSSKWSAYINQVQYLLDNTKLNFGAYAAIIRSDYLPSDGMQRLDMGNLTLSKWAISNATRYSLPELPGQSAVTSYFYFNRNLLVAKTNIPGYGDFYILNTHTEPFDEQAKDDNHTKKKHIDFFKNKMDKLVAEGYKVFGGGDFNAMPNNSDAWEGFPDAEGELASKASYVGEEDWMDSLMTTYNSALTVSDFEGSDTPGVYTFPANYSGNPGGGAWNRTLDYIFSTETLSSTRVLQSETYEGLLSDHAPIFTLMEL